MPYPDYRRLPVIPARPSVPCPFAAGTLEVPPGESVGLLDLIHQEINRDVPGTSTQFTISSDPTNQAPVYFGAFMGNPLQKHGPQSIWDGGQSIWDNGQSEWDIDYSPPNEPRPGKLTYKNYGWLLTPQGEPLKFHSSYPGTQTPIGVLQVFSEAPAKIHIVVVE